MQEDIGSPEPLVGDEHLQGRTSREQNDNRLKLMELRLRERELDIKERELGLDRKRSLHFTATQATVAVALIAALSGAISGIISAWSTHGVEAKKSEAMLSIERLKVEGTQALERQKQQAASALARSEFETKLIFKAIEGVSDEERTRNLQFFLKAGFLHDPEGKIARLDPDEYPSTSPPEISLGKMKAEWAELCKMWKLRWITNVHETGVPVGQSFLESNGTEGEVIKKIDELGVYSQLGRAVLYDSATSLGIKEWSLTRSVNSKLGGSPAEGIDEQKWIREFVKEWREYYETHRYPPVRKLVFRVNTFDALIGTNNWDLNPPIKVMNQEISSDLSSCK